MCSSRALVLAPVAVAVLTLTLLSGCSSGIASPVHSPSAIQPTTPEQAPAFEDGVITREEYEAAILNTVQCMRDQGVDVPPPTLQGGWRLAVSWTSTEPTMHLYTKCNERFAIDIAARWSDINEPTQAERDEARRWVQECLAERGQEVSLDELTPRSVADYVALGQTYPDFTPCFDAAQAEFGFQAI